MYLFFKESKDLNDKKGKKTLLLCVLFVVLAFLATYPAFLAGYFKMTMDGQIHFIKFEAITEAFKHHEMPSPVNFMGYGNIGEVFTGMYPWVAGIIFVIPKLIIHQPVYALFGGFFLLNLLTLGNTYLLASEVTKNLYWRILGVILYEFNSYHMIVTYGRNAIGEAIAYTFLPLVFCGCIQIWNKNKIGLITLGLGMGMIVDSHAITTLIACIVIFVIECGRIVAKKISIKEMISFILAGIFATLTASYTLYNMLNLMLKNHLMTPWKAMGEIIPSLMWNAMMDNDIGDKSNAWNIGLVAFLILVVLTVRMFQTDFGIWKIWISGSLLLLLLMFSWLPHPNLLAQSFLGNIQFLGRLFSFVMIFLTIGSMSYLEQYGLNTSFRATVICLSSLMVILSMSGIYKYHLLKGDDPIRYYVNNDNYLSSLSERDSGWIDYMISDENDQPIYEPGSDKIKVPVKMTKVTYKEIEYQVTSKKDQVIVIPFVIYNGIEYNVSVNGKIQQISTGELLQVRIKKGVNSVKVTTKQSSMDYVLFGLTCGAIVLGSGLILLSKYKKRN